LLLEWSSPGWQMLRLGCGLCINLKAHWQEEVVVQDFYYNARPPLRHRTQTPPQSRIIPLSPTVDSDYDDPFIVLTETKFSILSYTCLVSVLAFPNKG